MSVSSSTATYSQISMIAKALRSLQHHSIYCVYVKYYPHSYTCVYEHIIMLMIIAIVGCTFRGFMVQLYLDGDSSNHSCSTDFRELT